MECSVITPYCPPGGYLYTCSQVSCSSFTPSCFVPTNSSLCGYLSGIDSALCALQDAGSVNVSCQNVVMSSNSNPYPCIPFTTSSMDLCDWSYALEAVLCSLEAAIPLGTNTNQVTDGSNGTMSGSVTGMVTNANSTFVTDNTVVHGNSTTSGLWTSTSTGTNTVSTSTVIAVIAGQTYQARAFIYATAGSYPTTGVVSISINGTGQQISTGSINLADAQTGAWLIDPVIYVPDVNQNITITITCTNFTSGKFLNVADLIFDPVTASNATKNYDYNVAQINDLNGLYTAIANNITVIGGTITTSGASLTGTVAPSSYVVNGKKIYAKSASVTFLANLTNYIFYDTWIDGYVIKTNNGLTAPPVDSTQMLLYTAVTSGSGVTSTTDNRVYTPFTGTQIAAGTITGGDSGQIASATITDYNLNNSGVSASTYGDATHVGQFTVSDTGRITDASAVAITFPVTSVNGKTGVVSLKLDDLSNVSISSPVNYNILQYNGTDWVNTSLSSAGLISSSGSPLNHYLAFWTAAGVISGTANWQQGAVYSTNYGISVGTGTTPTESLDIGVNYNGFSRLKINNAYVTASNSAQIGASFLSNGTSYLDIYAIATNFTTSGIYVAQLGVLENVNGAGVLINSGVTGTPTPIQFAVGQAVAATIDTSGRFIMASGAICDSIQTSSATSGTVVANGKGVLLLTGATATVVITDPAAPFAGQHWVICTNQASTTISFTNTSHFYNGSLPSSVTYAQGHEFVFDSAKWVQLY